jgi:LAO/AO transport system kinase
MELADLVVVNKADGELAAAARATASDYASALHLVQPKVPAWTPRVVTCSALRGDGIDDVWAAIEAFRAAVGDEELRRLRSGQARDWMWAEIGEALDERLRADAEAAGAARRLEADVVAGVLPAPVAAEQVLDTFLGPGRARGNRRDP